MQFLQKRILSTLLFLFSAPLFAQEQGLDERINEAFTPIANWWGGSSTSQFPRDRDSNHYFSLGGRCPFLYRVFRIYQYQAFPNGSQYCAWKV